MKGLDSHALVGREAEDKKKGTRWEGHVPGPEAVSEMRLSLHLRAAPALPPLPTPGGLPHLSKSHTSLALSLPTFGREVT